MGQVVQEGIIKGRMVHKEDIIIGTVNQQVLAAIKFGVSQNK